MVSPARSTGNQLRHLPAVEDDDRPTIDKPPKGELWSDPLIASDFANLVEYPPLLPHAVQVSKRSTATMMASGRNSTSIRLAAT
jgi:hypothetical protein